MTGNKDIFSHRGKRRKVFSVSDMIFFVLKWQESLPGVLVDSTCTM